jgi:hypothetical protein
MEGQKSAKEIKVELMGILGTLKEKLVFCQKSNSSKNFLSIFNSLYKDPNFKDGSEIFEYQVYEAMLSKDDCPKEIVDQILKMPFFEGQHLAYKSIHISSKNLSKVLKHTIGKIKTLQKSKEGMTQNQLDILTSLAKNPNLSRIDRLSLEKFCDLLSDKHYDDCLLNVCVKYTQRKTWLSERFSFFVKRGGNNFATLLAMIENPLAKDHVIDYAARQAFSPEHVRILVNHPNISPNSLEILKNRFPKMETYIEQIISSHLDDDCD